VGVLLGGWGPPALFVLAAKPAMHFSFVPLMGPLPQPILTILVFRIFSALCASKERPGPGGACDRWSSPGPGTRATAETNMCEQHKPAQSQTATREQGPGQCDYDEIDCLYYTDGAGDA